MSDKKTEDNITKNTQVLVDMQQHQAEFQRENGQRGALFFHVEISSTLVGYSGPVEGLYILLDQTKLLKKGFQCDFDSYEQEILFCEYAASLN